MEQDHRGIKQRYYPMRSFGSFDAVARFCSAHAVATCYAQCRVAAQLTISVKPRPDRRRRQPGSRMARHHRDCISHRPLDDKEEDTAMEAQWNITPGFIEHTVKWALTLPVQA